MKNIAESRWFGNSITAAIVIAGILVGLETYPAVMQRHGTLLHLLDQIVLWIFVVEIVVKMSAAAPRPWRYFLDPWNVFDFTIVVAAFMPFAGSSVAVLRLLRLLRVLKLVRAIPRLQLIVSALLRSIPSMGYVSILMFLLFYVYAVAAVIFWSENDPIHFENLQLALVSLFRAVTLEDWTDLMYIQMYGCDKYGYGGLEKFCVKPSASPIGGALFFISFVMVGTMIMLNLFIGVIMNGMDEARAEQIEEDRKESLATGENTIHAVTLELKQKMVEINQLIAAVEKMSDEHGEFKGPQKK